MLKFIVLFISLAYSNAQPQINFFAKTREAVLRGDNQAALSELESQPFAALQGVERALALFLKGVLQFEKQNWSQAKEAFESVVGMHPGLDVYIYYFLGQVYLREGDLKKARQNINKTLPLDPPYALRNQMRMILAEIDMQEGNTSAAVQNLRYLERRWRRSDEHPQVLWTLVQAEQKLKRQSEVCRWAKKLYVSHPEHPLIADWGVDLQQAVVGDKKLGCLVSRKDQQKRIRRLQWAGEADRARRELDILRQRTPKNATGEVDTVLANYFVNQGLVEEAMRLLLPHYENQKNNVNYLTLLGKTAARAGEYLTAVGAYYRAHQLAPNSKVGREALFQSASLSYQFQDYDGALAKFERFMRQYSRSGLSRDAKWHRAWIRYLRGDYSGALQEFRNARLERKRVGRRWITVANERVTYWMAMSHLRLKEVDDARKLFEDVVTSSKEGFYGRAAQARLRTLPKATQKKLSVAKEESGITAPTDGEESTSVASSEEANESEETLAAQQQSADEEPAEADEAPEANDDEAELWKATSLKDPRLRQRFETARDFMIIGLNYLANYELGEIERRTRNPGFLKLLLSAYQGIEVYHRSSYIGETYFGGLRSRQPEEARVISEYTYPQAYKVAVDKYASMLALPLDWIWGIMRSESQYKSDAISPVGARGLMQIMPETARQVARLAGEQNFVVQSLNDPEVNIRLGAHYLQRLGKRFDRQLPLVAAAYNAGPHRVENWLAGFGNLETDEFIEHIPFLETRNYVKKVVKNYGIYQNLYRKNPDTLLWLKDSIRFKLTGRPSTRESWE